MKKDPNKKEKNLEKVGGANFSKLFEKNSKNSYLYKKIYGHSSSDSEPSKDKEKSIIRTNRNHSNIDKYKAKKLISHFDSISFPSVSDKMAYMSDIKRLEKKLDNLKKDFMKLKKEIPSISVNSQFEKFQESLKTQSQEFREEMKAQSQEFREEMKNALLTQSKAFSEEIKNAILTQSLAFREEIKNAILTQSLAFREEIKNALLTQSKAFREELKDSLLTQSKAFREEMKTQSQLFREEMKTQSQLFQEEMKVLFAPQSQAKASDK